MNDFNQPPSPCLKSLTSLLLRHAAAVSAGATDLPDTEQAAYEDLRHKGLGNEAARVMAEHGYLPDDQRKGSPRFEALIKLQFEHAAGSGALFVNPYDNEEDLRKDLRASGLGKQIDEILARYPDQDTNSEMTK